MCLRRLLSLSAPPLYPALLLLFGIILQCTSCSCSCSSEPWKIDIAGSHLFRLIQRRSSYPPSSPPSCSFPSLARPSSQLRWLWTALKYASLGLFRVLQGSFTGLFWHLSAQPREDEEVPPCIPISLLNMRSVKSLMSLSDHSASRYGVPFKGLLLPLEDELGFAD